MALPVARMASGAGRGWFISPELPLVWLIPFMATAAQVLIAARGRTAGLLLVAAVLVGAVAPLRAIGLYPGSEPALGLQAPVIWIYVLGLGSLVWRALGPRSAASRSRRPQRASGRPAPPVSASDRR